MLCGGANSQLANAGSYVGHGLPVVRLKPLLNQVELVAGNAPRILGESSEVLAGGAYPEERFHGRYTTFCMPVQETCFSGVGVRRRRLWRVRVVTATREPSSGMKRRSRAMARAGEQEQDQASRPDPEPSSAGFKMGWRLSRRYAALRRPSKDLAGWSGKRPQKARRIWISRHIKGTGQARDPLRPEPRNLSAGTSIG
jgi:hypothetical protein